MNKTDIVKAVSDKTLITETDASIILDVIFDTIKESLLDGEDVKVREFGTFLVQSKQSRLGVHPKTQEHITIPEKKVIKFRVSNGLKRKVNNA